MTDTDFFKLTKAVALTLGTRLDPVAVLTYETELGTLGFDSFDRIEFALYLEEELELTGDIDTAIMTCETLGDVARSIDAIRAPAELVKLAEVSEPADLSRPDPEPEVNPWDGVDEAQLVKFEIAVWNRNGDHPKDYAGPRTSYEPNSGGVVERPGSYYRDRNYEGAVVRYFRHPAVPGHLHCPHCDRVMHDHGFLDQYPFSQTVCPGDLVITLGPKRYLAVKPSARPLLEEFATRVSTEA